MSQEKIAVFGHIWEGEFIKDVFALLPFSLPFSLSPKPFSLPH